MIIADEHDPGLRDGVANLGGIENRVIGLVSIAEVAKIFSSAGMVVGSDFALDARESMKLRGGTPTSKNPRGRHKITEMRRPLLSDLNLCVALTQRVHFVLTTS